MLTGIFEQIEALCTAWSCLKMAVTNKYMHIDRPFKSVSVIVDLYTDSYQGLYIRSLDGKTRNLGPRKIKACRPNCCIQDITPYNGSRTYMYCPFIEAISMIIIAFLVCIIQMGLNVMWIMVTRLQEYYLNNYTPKIGSFSVNLSKHIVCQLNW